MYYFFGSCLGEREKKINTNKNIEQIENNIGLLNKREVLLKSKIDKETKDALEFIVKKDRDSAAICLTRKRQYQNERTTDYKF
jgi:hypothetical protein